MLVAWTSRYEVEFFETEADYKQFCLLAYGPDKHEWVEADEVKPWKAPRSSEACAYHAIAWWPRTYYEKVPDEPCVASCWGTKAPNVNDYTLDADKGVPTYKATNSQNKVVAEHVALAEANKHKPVYEEKFSSATSAGTLPVFVRADMPLTKKQFGRRF